MHQIIMRTNSLTENNVCLRLASLPSACFFNFRLVWVTALFDCALDTDYKRKGKSYLYRPATVLRSTKKVVLISFFGAEHFKIVVANSFYT